MQKIFVARTAGVIGMAGAVLWIIRDILQASLGLYGSGTSLLFSVHRLFSIISMISILIGILGFLWGGAVKGTLGKIAIVLFALGYAVLVLSDTVVLLTGSVIDALYPMGGILSLLGAVFTGIAVAVEKRWSGWQRFMPLIHAAFVFLVMYLPLFAANQEPTPLTELLWGVSLFFMGFAVYSNSRQTETVSLKAAV